MKRQTKELYTNKKQLGFLQATQKNKIWVGGRGSGKTTNIGDTMNLVIQSMPRAKGYLLGKTFSQVFGKFLPEVLDRLSQYGYKEHIDYRNPGHYVVCKQPPKYFQKPFKKPRRYDVSVFFINGFFIDLMSFDRPDLGRGGSYDICWMDEAALIKKDVFDKTLSPLLRGNIREWNHPMRFTQHVYTSRSWTSYGKWVENDMKNLAAEFPEEYYYMETSALDNIEVLGEEYFKKREREMDPLTYAVEILNEETKKLPNGYYPYLDEEVHLYYPENDYNQNESGVWVMSKEGDLDPSLPIEPSFDFNSKFTSASVWQDTGEQLNCLRQFFIKYDHLNVLVDNICDHYINHPTKIAYIYGGKDGNTTRALTSELDYYGLIIKRFKERGWYAVIKADFSWADKEHKVKYEVMNSILRENDPTLPKIRINSHNAMLTFRSMASTPIKGDFQKDKSSELDDSVQQEYATHLGDTVDNYIIPKLKGKVIQGSSFDLKVFTA